MLHSRWHLVSPVSVWSVGPFVSQTVTEISKSKYTRNLHPPGTIPLLSQENVKAVCLSLLETSSRATRQRALRSWERDMGSPVGFKRVFFSAPTRGFLGPGVDQGWEGYYKQDHCVVLIHTCTPQAHLLPPGQNTGGWLIEMNCFKCSEHINHHYYLPYKPAHWSMIWTSSI